MPIPPLTIPHRSPTVIFAAAGYGLAILLWLGMEDSTIWPVPVLGAGLALGNVALGYLRDITGMNTAMFLHAGLGLFLVILAAGFFRFMTGDHSSRPGH